MFSLRIHRLANVLMQAICAEAVFGHYAINLVYDVQAHVVNSSFLIYIKMLLNVGGSGGIRVSSCASLFIYFPFSFCFCA